MLAQILHPDAIDRINRIRLVKPQRATDVESRLIVLAQSGQLRGKVTEEQLKDLLGALSENENKKSGRIKVVRRNDDDLDDLLAELDD
jgi:programmed cell death protein 5